MPRRDPVKAVQVLMCAHVPREPGQINPPIGARPRAIDAVPAIPAGRHAEATEVLDLLLAFFDDGPHWIRGRLEDQHGNRCLIGGLQYVAQHHRIDLRSRTEAELCLLRALGKRRRDSLITYNDGSGSFAEVRALILKARELTALPDTGKHQSQRRRQPRLRQWQAPAISDGNPLTEPECASLAKLEAAEARKRRLLAEIELEKVARAAIGDTRQRFSGRLHNRIG